MKSVAQLGRWGVLALAVVLAACGESGDDGAPVGGNAAPTISGTPLVAVSPESIYDFAPSAKDVDGDSLTFQINAKPSWATFNTNNGRLSGTPRRSDSGTYTGIVISVTDGATETSLPPFDLTVGGSITSNRAPTISGTPATSIVAGNAYSFIPTASDPEGATLEFTVNNKPAWARFDAATGKLEGTPAVADVGSYANIEIMVSDGSAGVVLAAFGIVVTAPATNVAPVISGVPAASVEAGRAYSFTPTASDANNDTLTFTASGVPSWAGFDSRTGRIAGTAPSATGTSARIVIGVTDGKATASLAPFTIAVTAPTNNNAPTISGAPSGSATEGVAYSFQPTAADADGDALTFAIANRPAWATFNANTGRLQGTPGSAHVRTYSNIVISVSDGKASTPLATFSIAVAAANAAPAITGTPATTATVGTQYAFAPTGTDSNGDTLTYSIANKPAWATFSTSTGRLQGTPAAANVGTASSIVISVSDGEVSTSLAAFSIVVSNAANRAPTITGTPATAVTQNSAYSFQPSAADADNEVLTFSIANKPAWATFSTSTGRLSGTPTAADVGTTNGVVISVTDGAATTSLVAFSVTVQATAFGSATLTWIPPTQNTDGSALTNLSGYKIYWGTTQGAYSNSVTLNGPGFTSYVVQNLVPGTYYFAATALNAVGVESQFSGVASKTIL
jgi:nitrite reductase/ring-hydroxylating ferredoxin subunit